MNNIALLHFIPLRTDIVYNIAESRESIIRNIDRVLMYCYVERLEIITRALWVLFISKLFVLPVHELIDKRKTVFSINSRPLQYK